jgi:membrane-bound serine protease (ClpP class)
MLFIIVGIILIFSEILVPLYGFFALVGLALIIAGSVLSYDPTLAEYGMAMILAVSLSLSLVIGGGGFFAFKAYRKKTETGKEGLIGDDAVIVDWNDTQGRVFIDGESWHAEAEKSYDFKKDDVVRVTEMRDLTLMIEPKT